jgi:hypothetical protein
VNHICSICCSPIEIVGTWDQGHNAQPVNDGRCCGECNTAVVIPARLAEVFSRSKVSNQRFPRETQGT